MCGRFALRYTDFIPERFHISEPFTVPIPRYNIAPTQEILAIISQNNIRKAVTMTWGITAAWQKHPIINARSENMEQKPIFAQALRANRCVVPCDGYYEWKREGKQRIPYFIRLRSDTLFGVAGIFSTETNKTGQIRYQCALLTTAANALLEPIHSRMDVILTPQQEDIWLLGSSVENIFYGNLQQPYPSEEMEIYPVSDRVNSVRNDDPELPIKLILPHTDYPEQQTLFS